MSERAKIVGTRFNRYIVPYQLGAIISSQSFLHFPAAQTLVSFRPVGWFWFPLLQSRPRGGLFFFFTYPISIFHPFHPSIVLCLYLCACTCEHYTGKNKREGKKIEIKKGNNEGKKGNPSFYITFTLFFFLSSPTSAHGVIVAVDFSSSSYFLLIARTCRGSVPWIYGLCYTIPLVNSYRNRESFTVDSIVNSQTFLVIFTGRFTNM